MSRFPKTRLKKQRAKTGFRCFIIFRRWQIKKINIDQIVPDPNQPRKSFPEASLKELADSYNGSGPVQPITVKTNGDGKFMIITNTEENDPHYQKKKTETFYCLAGVAKVCLGADKRKCEQGMNWAELKTGDQITIEPGQWHRMFGKKAPAIILEVSTHDDDKDTQRE